MKKASMWFFRIGVSLFLGLYFSCQQEDPSMNEPNRSEVDTIQSALWGSWENLGQSPASRVAAVGYSSVYDIFVQGGDHALYHRHFDGATWKSWESLGGYLTAPPAASYETGGKMKVFAQGGEGDLWVKEFDGVSWGSWTDLGGAFRSTPVVAYSISGIVDVYMKATAGSVFHRRFEAGAWRPLEGLGGNISGDLAAGYIDGNPALPYICGRGSASSDLQCLRRDSSGWESWESLGGNLTSNPTISDNFVFAAGGERALWYRKFNRSSLSWSSWTSLGGYLTADPSSIKSINGKIYVFARGGEGAAWSKSFDGTSWTSWQTLGGYLNGPVTPFEPYNLFVIPPIQIFAIGGDSAVWHTSGR